MFRRKRTTPPMPRGAAKTLDRAAALTRLTEATHDLAEATERLGTARRSVPPPPITSTQQPPPTVDVDTEKPEQSGKSRDRLPWSTKLLIGATTVVVLAIALVIAAVVVATQIAFYRTQLTVQTVDLSRLGIAAELDLPTFTPIATEGVAWACTLMAVALVLLNRQAGLWTHSMWAFSSINATVNAWHALTADNDPLGALVKGGLSIAGPFIVHLLILWVRHIRTGKTVQQAQADMELKWKALARGVKRLLGAVADHATHPVVAARAFSWWRLHKHWDYAEAWRRAVQRKLDRVQADEQRGEVQRGEAERVEAGEPTTPENAEQSDCHDVEPQEQPQEREREQRRTQPLAVDDVDASFQELIRGIDGVIDVAPIDEGQQAPTAEAEDRTAETEQAEAESVERDRAEARSEDTAPAETKGPEGGLLNDDERATAKRDGATAALKQFFDRVHAEGGNPTTITRAELARELGCSPRNVSKALSKWQSEVHA
jgi:hypothetical protein